ncbi:hypothetical protein B7P43_G10460 [Cryptotermes secundus]|uniref:Uncharacterized protein n=1 Tax=Cryptotermes secundus TaxID=105785 RepID=A0A2J7RL93_9NEOP|nr:hypothetical protein B7P43_G10460 [Cryptotermes secundus]
MALETDRCSPSSASSPGPASSTRPGSDHSSLSNRSASPDSCRSLCCNSNSPQPPSILHTPSASHETPHLMHHTPQPPPPLFPPHHQEQRCQCCRPVSPLIYAGNAIHNTRTPKSTPSSPSHNRQPLCNPVHTRTPPFSSPSPHSASPSPQSSLPPSPSQNRHHQPSPPDHQQPGSSPNGQSPRPTNNERVPQPTTLPFSVANILRPDFGRRAVITSKQHESLYRPGAIRRAVTPICDYQRLYRPHEHLPGVQPLPAPKATKKQPSSWSPVTATRASSLPEETANSKASSNHRHARSKDAQLPVQSSGTASPPLSPASSTVSATSSTPDEKLVTGDSTKGPQLWPAWVYCTRYSDRPSSGKKGAYYAAVFRIVRSRLHKEQRRLFTVSCTVTVAESSCTESVTCQHLEVSGGDARRWPHEVLHPPAQHRASKKSPAPDCLLPTRRTSLVCFCESSPTTVVSCCSY